MRIRVHQGIVMARGLYRLLCIMCCASFSSCRGLEETIVTDKVSIALARTNKARDRGAHEHAPHTGARRAERDTGQSNSMGPNLRFNLTTPVSAVDFRSCLVAKYERKVAEVTSPRLE